MNAENHGQEILPGMAVARLTEAQVRFCQLMAAGFDDQGNKLNQTQCAVKAGVGTTNASSRTLATRYMKDPRILARIKELELEAFGEIKIRPGEVFNGLRLVLEIATGQKKVKKTIFSKGGLVGNKDVYDPDLGVANQALKTMAEIAGVAGNKKTIEHSGGLSLSSILSDLDGTTAGLPED